MKLRISMKKAVFSQDLDGDMEAEVPPEREGETNPPEVDIDGGLDDSNNDGKTDSPTEPSPEEPDAKPMDDKPEEAPGDDELANAWAISLYERRLGFWGDSRNSARRKSYTLG